MKDIDKQERDFREYVLKNAKITEKICLFGDAYRVSVSLFNQHALTMDAKTPEKVLESAIKNYVSKTLNMKKHLERRGFKVEFINK